MIGRSGTRAMWVIASAAALMLMGPSPVAAKAPGAIDEAARLLAGLSLREGSDLRQAFASEPGYAAYVRQIDQSWSRYQAQTLDPIRAWVKTELKDVEAPVVFYPFSGPDILNALAFFPKSRRFIMLGLEKIGRIPDPARRARADTIAGVVALRGALRLVLGVNFFRTAGMSKRIGAHPDSGVAGVLMFFLVRSGYEILDARLIELSVEGAIVPEGTLAGRKGHRDHGVEIKFRRRGTEDPTKTVYYFRGDVSDRAWSRRPGLPAFVHQQGEMATFLKAASYLMYEPAFDDIRSTILSRSRLVVGEASGIPFHYFGRDTGWTTRLFGRYQRPIKLFKRYCQPDLRNAIVRDNAGALGFPFGYNHRIGTSHLIVARRRRGFEVVEPVFDRSRAFGERTRCRRGRLTLWNRPRPLKRVIKY